MTSKRSTPGPDRMPVIITTHLSLRKTLHCCRARTNAPDGAVYVTSESTPPVRVPSGSRTRTTTDPKQCVMKKNDNMANLSIVEANAMHFFISALYFTSVSDPETHQNLN